MIEEPPDLIMVIVSQKKISNPLKGVPFIASSPYYH